MALYEHTTDDGSHFEVEEWTEPKRFTFSITRWVQEEGKPRRATYRVTLPAEEVAEMIRLIEMPVLGLPEAQGT